MKVKTTAKELKNNYNNIISVGYCGAYYLLIGQEPRYYTCGVYGWKSDNYHINNNVLISTGYAPVDGVRNYDLVKKYNEKAQKIYNNYNLKYETRKNKINKLLDEFINKMLENN